MEEGGRLPTRKREEGGRGLAVGERDGGERAADSGTGEGGR